MAETSMATKPISPASGTMPVGDDFAVIVLSVGAPVELADAVRSLINQIPFPEIIVVNSGGGSVADRLGTMLDHVIVLDFPRLLWPGAARNRGIAATKARYIGFLAADCEGEPGWVAARLARHRAGCSAVASCVVNRFPRSATAIASHLALFPRRLPHLPEQMALRYGASYDRHLFSRYGLFREDLRVGEDTEFRLRLPKDNQPVWAPEVRTAHRNSTSIREALNDQYERGLRAAHYWPQGQKGRYFDRWRKRTGDTLSLLQKGLTGQERVLAWVCSPLIVLQIAAFHLGVTRVAKLRDELSRAIKIGDHGRMLSIYKAVWERLGDGEVLSKMLQLLVTLDRTDEAQELLKSINTPRVPERLHVTVAAGFYKACHQWQSLVRLLDEHHHYLADDTSLLKSYVQASSVLGQPEKGVSAVARYGGSAPQAPFLKIGALFRARKFSEVSDLAEEVLASQAPIHVPTELLGPILSSALRRGGVGLARDLLERIEPYHPKSNPRKLNELASVFYRARLRSCDLLDRPTTPLKRIEPKIEQRIGQVLAAQGHQKKSPLRKLCRKFQWFRDVCPDFYPDPSFDLFDAVRVADRISAALKSGQPFSLIRLGDGEGNLLSYTRKLAAFQHLDSAATLRAWWGEGLDAKAVRPSLSEALEQAIGEADIIGIPDLNRIVRSLWNADIRSTAASGKTIRGLLTCLDFVESRGRSDPAWLRSRVITSCHIHQSLELWGLWEILMPQIKEVALITCHHGLADVLAARHGLRIAAVHQVPPEEKYAVAFSAANEERHFPDGFAELSGLLRKPQHGRVFLVAAGLLGKLYCNMLKQAGGIALDIGSAADYWCGHNTRSLDEMSNFLPIPNIASRLRRLQSVDSVVSNLFASEAPSTSGIRAIR